jgi:hypothetical protein
MEKIMQIRRLLGITFVLSLTAVLLSGCFGFGESKATPTPVAVASPTPSPSPTPTPVNTTLKYTGVYVGQIDDNSIEVKQANAGTDDDFMVFRFTDELAGKFDGLDLQPNDTVTVTYQVDTNGMNWASAIVK